MGMYSKRHYVNINLIIFSSLFILLFSSGLFAAGPKAGEYFYRVDTRIPDEIIGTTALGAGFSTWATSRGVPPNNNVLDYLHGVSVRPAPITDRNAGWVSVAGDIFAATNFLETEIVPPSSHDAPPIEERSQWIYQISPSADAYNVNWMLTDALQNMPDSQIQRGSLVALLTFSSENEWIVRGGVPAQYIHSAQRFQYNTSTREFDQTTDVVYNPRYVEPPRPEPQTENLIVTSSIPTTIYGYQDSQAHTANISIAPVLPYSSSCASAGSSQSSRTGKSNSGCDFSASALKSISLTDTPTILSKLVIEAGYCLQPVNATTQSLLWTRSYLWANNCDDNKSSQKAYYDIAGRVVVPRDDDGIQVCLTAPENVITGKTQWDYVRFWPCDISNPYQTWLIKDGKFHSVQKPELYIKFSSGWYGIMSSDNGDGSNEILAKNKMTAGFFDNPSLPGYTTKEIGISWGGSGSAYYPSRASYSESYTDRTYYDMETKQISMLSYNRQSFPGVAVSRTWKCLVSRQGKGGSWWDWDWAFWYDCNSNYIDQKWSIDDSRNPIDNIHYKDAAGNTLYFNLSSSLNYGFPYTQKGSAQWGSLLNIRRSYGICSSLNSWKFCRTPKHSYQENGGIW